MHHWLFDGIYSIDSIGKPAIGQAVFSCNKVTTAAQQTCAKVKILQMTVFTGRVLAIDHLSSHGDHRIIFANRLRFFGAKKKLDLVNLLKHAKIIRCASIETFILKS